MARRREVERQKGLPGFMDKVTESWSEDGVLVEEKETFIDKTKSYLAEHKYGDGLKFYWYKYDIDLERQNGRLTPRNLEVFRWKPSTGRIGKVEVEEFYHDNGIVRIRYEYGADGRTSLEKIKQFGISGQLISTQEYVLGNGKFIGYDLDGSINCLGQYEDGMKEGQWIRKDKNSIVVTWYSSDKRLDKPERQGLRVWPEYLDEYGVS